LERNYHILILEDVASDAELIERELRKADIAFTPNRVETKEAFLTALVEFQPDIVLSDYNLPQFSGLEALRLLKQAQVSVPFILITGALTEEVAVECMKEGADDYILKSSLKRLSSAVLNVLDKQRVAKEKQEAEEALRQSEEQLRQAQKLEAIGQLAGGVAHDFNNLLTVIIGYSDLLLKRSGSSPNSAAEEIKKAAERAASLTRQLLAFSRKQVMQRKVFDLNNLVVDMAKMCHRLIGEDIELVIRATQQVARINADPSQIEQVLMNLIVNARDAMPRGGKLTVETATLQIDESHLEKHMAAQPGPYTMLGVSDTGVGMDPETKKHIFEPFFTTKEQGKGTGLGLATVYGIVKQSGGSILVHSEPGAGTTFRIYFPSVDKVTAASPCVDERAAVPGSGETILVVEDDAQVRRMTATFLRKYGYEVLVATRGDQALKLFEQKGLRVDLIITDVVMPKMSGRELTARLDHLLPNVKVLYMSGYPDDVLRHELDEKISFLQKPFTPDALAIKVREVLNG
jgi:two-component system cell cycle sensor histidine kinase/response regulator CckA